MGASDVVYVEKRRSPITDPWGTPVTNWCALDASSPQATRNDLPVRFDSNQRNGIPVMSNDERVDRRIWWLTVSKAADKSSRIRTEQLLPLIEKLISNHAKYKSYRKECNASDESWILAPSSGCLICSVREPFLSLFRIQFPNWLRVWTTKNSGAEWHW